jgi:hypothetical protein
MEGVEGAYDFVGGLTSGRETCPGCKGECGEYKSNGEHLRKLFEMGAFDDELEQTILRRDPQLEGEVVWAPCKVCNGLGRVSVPRQPAG